MINKSIKLSLTGMMGAGKTSIGKILAEKINLPFYDSDLLIEDKLDLEIKDIFSIHGEDYFRNQEEEVCKNILKKEKFILALGGGGILNKRIRESINNETISIYLKTDQNILFERLKNDKSRPLLQGSNLKKKINDIISEREKFYLKSNIVVDNNINDIELITEKIISLIKNYNS